MATQRTKRPNHKVGIIGKQGVGKSSLRRKYGLEYDIDRLAVDVANEPSTVQVIERPTHKNKTDFTSSVPEYCFRVSDGFMCVYSITKRESFVGLENLIKQILRIKRMPRVPMLIIGNKCEQEEIREVSPIEGLQLAKKYGCEFYEVSAACGANTAVVFNEILHCIHKHKKAQDFTNTSCIVF